MVATKYDCSVCYMEFAFYTDQIDDIFVLEFINNK